MAAPKVLGRVDLSAATAANVFASPLNGASFSVSVTNRGTTAAKIKLCLSQTTATIENAGLLEYEFSLSASDTLERTGLCIESGYFLVAESDAANISVVAYGWEA